MTSQSRSNVRTAMLDDKLLDLHTAVLRVVDSFVERKFFNSETGWMFAVRTASSMKTAYGLLNVSS